MRPNWRQRIYHKYDALGPVTATASASSTTTWASTPPTGAKEPPFRLERDAVGSLCDVVRGDTHAPMTANTPVPESLVTCEFRRRDGAGIGTARALGPA